MTASSHKGIMQNFSEEMIRIFPRRIVGPLDSDGFNQNGRSVG